MRHITKQKIGFAKKKAKKKEEEEPIEETSEETSEEDSEESEPQEDEDKNDEKEKANINVQALLAGMAEEMESRTILLQGTLDEEKSGEILSALLALAHLKPPKPILNKGDMPYDPITMYISTYGGSADEMFGLFDMMNICKKRCIIETVGMGKVMSAGTLLLAAGTKGHRKIGRNCRVMIHNVAAGTFGALPNMVNELEAIQKIQDDYINAMVSCTSLSKRKLKSLLNERVNVYLSAQEAVEYGLADEII
tara:strand:+ start:1963 stop:2715 length:753 start_codon:yes stop_codon:yes gene_type:complete